MGHWGTCPLEFANARKFWNRWSKYKVYFVSTYRPITHIKALITVTVAKKNFSHIRFCRLNARWLSLLNDFVTTNFGTRASRARAPPLEQNSGNATDGRYHRANGVDRTVGRCVIRDVLRYIGYIQILDYGIGKFKKAKKLHLKTEIRSTWTGWF